MSYFAGAITGAIGLTTSPLASAISRAKGLVHGLESETRSSFSRITSGAGGLALKIGAIGGAVIGVGSLIGGLGLGAKLAGDFEQAEVAFTTMLGSADEAQTLLGDLTQFAASTPFEFPGLQDASRKLLAFGSAGDQVIPELRTIGDIAAGTGQDISELAEIYGKARVQGRLMAEDINQLTGRGIPIIGELAKQFNVTESEVRGLVSEGKVGFSNLQQAFVSMAGEGGRFGGMMAAQSKTLNGLISTLKDNVGLLARSLVSDLFDRVDAKGFIADLTAAIPVVQGVLQGVVDLSINGLSELARWFGISGDKAESSGNRVLDAMQVRARGIAYVADMLDAAVYGYDMLRLGAAKFIGFAADGIAKLAHLAEGLPEWLGGGVATDVAEFADAFAANLNDEIAKLQDKIDDKLVAPSRGERVLAFFNGVKQKAQEAADAAGNVDVPEIQIAPDLTGGVDSKKSGKLLDSLKFQLEDIGLNDVEKKFADIRRDGLLNPDELNEARKLLDAIDTKTKVNAALESIKSPLEKYQAQMAELNDWFSKGLIDQQQFDQLSAKSSKDAFGQQKFAALNMAGSAEELQLRQKQAAAAAGAGPSGGKDYAKQQIDQQKQTNEKLDLLATLVRQWLSGGGEGELSIPGL